MYDADCTVMKMKKVGIIMGSDSDLPIIKKSVAVLEEFGYEKVG